MLLQHVSPENARSHGLTMHGDAVVNDSHTMYMIVDGPDREAIQRFFAPFAQMGAVEVMAASSCEAVVERGGCDAR